MFTQGPWIVDESYKPVFSDRSKCLVMAGDMCVCDVMTDNDKPSEANAQLIASAPELLEALKALRKELWAHHKMNVKKDFSLMVADVVASKAIEKAEGMLTT